MKTAMTTALNKILELAQEKCDEGTYLQIANLLKEAHNEKPTPRTLLWNYEGFIDTLIKKNKPTNPTHKLIFTIQTAKRTLEGDDIKLVNISKTMFISENSLFYRQAKSDNTICVRSFKTCPNENNTKLAEIDGKNLTGIDYFKVDKLKKLSAKELEDFNRYN
jgi:hypothetical protein